MKGNFKVVFCYSLQKKINKKFLRGFLTLIIILSLLVQVPAFLLKDADNSGLAEESSYQVEIYTSDDKLANLIEANLSSLDSEPDYQLDVTTTKDVDKLKEQEYLLDLDQNTLYKAESNEITYGEVNAYLNELFYNLQFLDLSVNQQLDPAVIADVMSLGEYQTEIVNVENEVNGDVIQGITFIFTILIYFVLIFTLQFTSQEILEEKSSRAMEIIMCSIKPSHHMLAKILSNITFILTIIVSLILVVLGNILGLMKMYGVDIGNLWTMLKEMMIEMNLGDILSGETLFYVVVLIGLYIITTMIITSLGAILVSSGTSMDELQKKTSTLTFVIFLPYLVSLMAVGSPMFDYISTISIYIPVFSIFFLPPMIITGALSIPITIIIVLIHVIILFVILKYGSYIYQVGVLNYTDISFKQLCKNAYQNYKFERK